MDTLHVKVFDETGADRSSCFPAQLELELDHDVVASDYLMDVDGGPVYFFSLEQPGYGTLRVQAEKQAFLYEFPVRVVDDGTLRLEFNTGTCVDAPKMCALRTVRAAEIGGGESSYQRLEITIEDSQEVVLLAGSDYPHIYTDGSVRGGGMRKVALALTRMQDLADDNLEYEAHAQGPSVADRPPFTAATVVTVFDAHTGRRTRWVQGHGKPKIKSWAWTSGWCLLDDELQGTRAPMLRNKAPASRGGLDPGADAFSITHVYDYIEHVGRKRPDSLAELSIFSHAYWNGPIIYNTNRRDEYDRGGTHYPKRDPLDHDARIADFDKGTELDRANMRAAFKSNAFVKIWGCNANRSIIRAIRKAQRSSTGMGLGIPAETRKSHRLKVKTDGEFEAEERNAPDTRDGFVELLRACEFTLHYAYVLSYFLDLPVWATPPGLWAEYLHKGTWYWNYIPVRTASITTKNGDRQRKHGTGGKLKTCMAFYHDHFDDVAFTEDHYMAYRYVVVPQKWGPPPSPPPKKWAPPTPQP